MTRADQPSTGEPAAVHAVWDDEAGGWTATSPELPGWRVEAPTYEDLLEAVRRAAGGRGFRIQASGFPGCGC